MATQMSKRAIRAALGEALRHVSIVGNELYYPAAWAGYRDAGDATTSTPILHRPGYGTPEAQRLTIAAERIAEELGAGPEMFEGEKSEGLRQPVVVECIHRALAQPEAVSSAAALLGRKGGSARTEAQNAARRENARKGGRPRIDVMAARERARGWIESDPVAIREDIMRLGLRGAARYEVDLIHDRAAMGDTRCLPMTVAVMLEVLREFGQK